MLREEVRLAIEQHIKQSSICAVMADITPDFSVVDQISVAARYINNETCKPEERLVKVTEVLDKSGAGLAASIISSLKSGGIPLSTVQFRPITLLQACLNVTKVRSKS